MKNAVILHGAGNDSQGNWFPWLHSEKLGGEVIIKQGEGHFNLEKSPTYKEFPLLLKLID